MPGSTRGRAFFFVLTSVGRSHVLDLARTVLVLEATRLLIASQEEIGVVPWVGGDAAARVVGEENQRPAAAAEHAVVPLSRLDGWNVSQSMYFGSISKGTGIRSGTRCGEAPGRRYRPRDSSPACRGTPLAGRRPGAYPRRSARRSKSRSLTDPQGRTYAQVIAEKLVEQAAAGDLAAAREVADRAEGRPSQALQIGVGIHRAIFEEHPPDETREQWLERMGIFVPVLERLCSRKNKGPLATTPAGA